MEVDCNSTRRQRHRHERSFGWVIHRHDPGIDFTIRTDQRPGTDSDYRNPRTKGQGDFGQGAVPPINSDHGGCRAYDKCVPGFTEPRGYNYVDPRVGGRGVSSRQQAHRCAVHRLGTPANTSHDSSKATTDNDGTIGCKGCSDLLSKSHHGGWGVSCADDCDLSVHGPFRLERRPTDPMLLWMLSTPFEGIFGSEDSGQTNDGPLVRRANSYQVTRLRQSVTRTMDRHIG